jgi:hypothetical protein
MRKDVKYRFAGVAAAVAMVSAGGAARAMPIELDGGWEANWNTTLSAGSTWRTEDPNNKLYKRADGARLGLNDGLGGSGSDSNTLNTKAGDRVSTIVKMVTDLEVKREEMGGLIRVKAWYDQVTAAGHGRYGHMNNGYNSQDGLSDNGFQAAQKFDGLQLLDAYVYNTFDAADHPVQIRAGRQAINWGESLFFQGVNQITPIDLPALRRPGSEIKEALLPVWSVDANIGLGGGVSVEGFYQFMWEPTSVDACGTYWSTVDIAIGTNPAGCNKIVLGNLSSAAAIAAGQYAPVVNGREARDDGQFGLSLKVPVEPLDTEFGLYAMNIHSRTPIVSGRTGTWGSTNPLVVAGLGYLNPMVAHQISTNPLLAGKGIKSASGYWEYPEDMQLYGVSATTNLVGWSVGGEVSFTPNLPVQRNPSDLMTAMLTGRGVLGTQAAQAGSLTDLRGYDRLQKTQLQVNGVKTFGGILGAAKSTLMGEAMAQFNNAPDYRSGTAVRYGRAFIFGTGSSAGYNTCNSTLNTQPDGCQNDGYVTPFAWGYRLRAQLEFPQIFDTGITFIPSLSIAHDVTGVSADGQLNEDRFATSVGARFTYERQYTLDLSYVTYANWAKYDPLRDHDFFSLSTSVTF